MAEDRGLRRGKASPPQIPTSLHKGKTPDKRGSLFARRIGEPSLACASSSQIRLSRELTKDSHEWESLVNGGG